MNDLLAVLNHLLAAWTAQAREAPGGPGALRVDEVYLEEDGFRIAGRLDHATAGGEFAVRGRIEQAGPLRHRIHLRLERCPERLAGALEPFRGVLESARVRVDLSFEDTGEA